MGRVVDLYWVNLESITGVLAGSQHADRVSLITNLARDICRFRTRLKALGFSLEVN